MTDTCRRSFRGRLPLLAVFNFHMDAVELGELARAYNISLDYFIR